MNDQEKENKIYMRAIQAKVTAFVTKGELSDGVPNQLRPLPCPAERHSLQQLPHGLQALPRHLSP